MRPCKTKDFPGYAEASSSILALCTLSGCRIAILLLLYCFGNRFAKERKTRKRTLANLSHWPEEQIAALRRVLKAETLVGPTDALEITRSLPHGHVAAVLGTMRRLGVAELIEAKASRNRDLVLTMIASRILDPRSKLATARGLDSETASNSLAAMVGIESVDEDDLYRGDGLVAAAPAAD